jgi:uncharacterized protein (TIGR02246 family)
VLSPTTNTDVGAIKQLGEEYFAATNAGNAERCIATMAPDIVIMPPDRPTIFGHEQLRALAHDYHATYDLKYSLVFDEVESHGNWGFARVSVGGTRTAKSDGAIEQLSWRNVWIVKKQSDGHWKFWRIIFNREESL